MNLTHGALLTLEPFAVKIAKPRISVALSALCLKFLKQQLARHALDLQLLMNPLPVGLAISTTLITIDQRCKFLIAHL